MKTCVSCGVTKSLEEFHWRNKARGYRVSRCKPCANAMTHAWRASNPDKVKASMAAWAEANRERSREASRQWRLANTERSRQQVKAWRMSHPEAAAEIQRRKRARKLSSSHNCVTPALLQDRMNAYGGQCFYCRTRPYEHIDHFVPLARGGTHCIFNLVPSCAHCNQSKGASEPFEFMARGRV